MQRSFLKNLNKLFLNLIIIIFFSCQSNDNLSAKLPLRETRWAQVIESQYSSWRRPIIKRETRSINPTLSNSKPFYDDQARNRRPDPINQAQFIPDSVTGLRSDSKFKIFSNSNYKQNIKSSKYYVVKKGDTLSKISKKVYGKNLYWKKIYDANYNILKTPNNLRVGQRILIP